MEITCRIGADATVWASQCEMRQIESEIESETESIIKLTRLAIREFAPAARDTSKTAKIMNGNITLAALSS